MKYWFFIIFTILKIEDLRARYTDKIAEKEFKVLLSDPNFDESIVLGRDIASGCLCRKYPVRFYVICYDLVNCMRFPKDVKFSVEALRVSSTGIEIMRKNDLLNNTHLTTISFEANDMLHTIEPGTFNNMSNLVNVTITHNTRLIKLHRNTFDGLDNVVYLSLKKNGFSSLKYFTPALNHKALPVLQTLVVAQYVFPNVLEDDFADMVNTTVKVFDLQTCSINTIHPNSLIYFKKLKELSLDDNNLHPKNVETLLQSMINEDIKLNYLNLQNMNLHELPIELLEFIATTNISHLGLSKNRFEVIEKFPRMNNIQWLDLGEVLALNISPQAFNALPNLTKLYLNGNQFSDIPEAVLMSQLEFLDISYASKYMSLPNDMFRNMKHLKYLNLSGNNARQILNNTFVGLKELEYLSIRDCMLYYIDAWTFVHLDNLLYLDLQSNTFPTRNLTKVIFDGLPKLEVLLLGDSKWDIIEDEQLFSNLISLKYLALNNNKLKSVPSVMFSNLHQLEILDINRNEFVVWDERLFEHNPKLHTVIASYNRIRNLTKEMVEDFVNLNILELYKNPFSCTCQDLKALYDISYYNESDTKNYSRIFELLQRHQLNCTFPEDYSNFTILDYLHDLRENSYCSEFAERTSVFLFVLPIFIIFIIFLISILLVYYYRWHIRYWVFLTKLAINRSGHSTKKARTCNTYEYDAFVSYSNEDRSFVVRLVTMLENYHPLFKLCVYERDFQIGTVISESVLESVAKSRKTLLIISDSYIRSQWCRWEAQVAENHRLFFENEFGECVNDSIVMIKLGNVSTRNLSPMLKYLMKTRIYLQWDSDVKKQKDFWDKLRNSLARPAKTNLSIIEANLM